jgi:hypothetical protein
MSDPYHSIEHLHVSLPYKGLPLLAASRDCRNQQIRQRSFTAISLQPNGSAASSGGGSRSDAYSGRVWSRVNRRDARKWSAPHCRSGEDHGAQDLPTKITRTAIWPFAVNNGSTEWGPAGRGALLSASGQPGDRLSVALGSTASRWARPDGSAMPCGRACTAGRCQPSRGPDGAIERPLRTTFRFPASDLDHGWSSSPTVIQLRESLMPQHNRAIW